MSLRGVKRRSNLLHLELEIAALAMTFPEESFFSCNRVVTASRKIFLTTPPSSG